MQRAYGLAHRRLGVPTTVDTQFAIASGSKGLTALTVMSLIERGELGLETTARSVLGTDLPLIDDRVTVEHLLAHRSGIGDYLDESEARISRPFHAPAGCSRVLIWLFAKGRGWSTPLHSRRETPAQRA